MRVCLALLLAAGAAGANLLRNPGMENWQCDTLLLDWNVEATGVTRVLRESDTIRSGAHSVRLVRLVAGTGNNRGLSQHVLVSPGRAYAYSVAYRDDEPRISLGLFITWRTADSTFISSEPVAYSRDSACWQTVAETADAPANAARADFVIRTYGASGAPAGLRVFCDDAYLDLADPQSETVRIWFTEDSLAARLCGFFNGATSSIDYCCYNSSRTDVTLCLISRRQAGIRIRVITDNSRLGDQWVAYLRGSGITVWTDSVGPNASAYMHNKFAIRDHDDVDTTNDRLWVASYNPNLDETFADHALEIPGPALCRAYLAEFNQMWGSAGRTPKPDSARFHTGKTDVLPSHEFTVEGTPARLYFAPQDRVVDTVTALAGRSGREVVFAVYSFTWRPLAEAMVAARNRGAVVGGLMDRSSANDPNSVYRYLRDNHVPVVSDSDFTVHEKVMVVDSTLCVTGSANWSNNANYSNDENTLLLSSPAICNRLHAEIVRRYVDAGGTWPPGVREAGSAPPPARPRPLFIRDARALPAGTVLYAATGRRAADVRLAPGVYFVGGSGARVVVAR